MDGELITINGVTAFVYYDDDSQTIEVINLHQLSHDLQTALDRLQMLERNSQTVQMVGDNLKSIKLAIALVDHMFGKVAR
jgi:ribosomal protein S2